MHNVVLKKTVVKDKSQDQEYLKKQYLQSLESQKISEQTNIENWISRIEDIIIPCLLIDINVQQAQSLVRVYESTYMNKPALNQEEQETLKQLGQIVESLSVKRFPDCLSKGFFVRLNTRSPKDARIFSKLMKEAIAKDVEKYKREKGKDVDDNAMLSIVYTNFVKNMKVHSGEEAIDILGKSYRIWQDITATLQSKIQSDPNGDSGIKIVVREWAGISPSLEFRGFVYNGTLNAISSYNRVVCWEGVPERKEEIKNLIVSYWDSIKHRFDEGLNKFIVDFAILDSNEVTIVELNDFNDYEGCGAHAELFDWNDDKEILTGKAPFEIRLVEKPLPRQDLEKRLTKPFRIWLGWEEESSWRYGVDYY